MSKFLELVMPKIDTEDAHDMDPETAAYIGWKECKEEVLKILYTKYPMLDLSPSEIDDIYIEKIKEL